MKKLLTILSLALLILAMVGCDLNPLNQHTLYFYSLAGEGNAPSSQTLKYRSDGHTIIMSRGTDGVKLDEAGAEALKGSTSFSLTLDGVALPSNNDKSVDELANGYHVVESFSLGVMDKGLHTLVGETVMTGIGTRTNTVTLTIK